MSRKLDEKLQLCLDFVLRQYGQSAARAEGGLEGDAAGCFVVGITGCQGWFVV